MSTIPTAGSPAHASSSSPASHGFDPLDTFARRHLGPDAAEIAAMLETLGVASVEALMAEAIPASIRMNGALELEKAPGDLGALRGEHEMLASLKALAERNEVFRCYIGMGYHGTITPPVIQRNVLENPGWYTQYTPYQAEIAQGRLEALLNFQTMVADLTGLPVANASLLDEATAAAEAMTHVPRRRAPTRNGVLRRRGLPSADDRGRRDPRRGARHRGAHRTGVGARDFDAIARSSAACCSSIRRPTARSTICTASPKRAARAQARWSSSPPICWR